MRKKSLYPIISISIIILFLIFGLWLVKQKAPNLYGEWDDYSLLSISFINDGNYTIDSDDIEMLVEWIPECAVYTQYISLSHYTTSNGEGICWYYPLFSSLAIPFFVILHLLGKSAVYAIPLFNLLLYESIIIIILCWFDAKKHVRILYAIAMCMNPAILLIPYISGEIFIMFFLFLSVIFWKKGKNNMAALCIAIASTLNMVVLFWGILMILNFLYQNYVLFARKQLTLIHYVKKTILFGSCYVPGLLPMIRNYRIVGHINLTAATETDLSIKRILWRFFSYLFDMNLGFLPYYSLFLILFVCAIVGSIKNHERSQILLIICFVGIVFLYSFEIHINCGMSGIARYNGWSGIILLFIVFTWINQLGSPKKKLNHMLTYGCVLVSVLWMMVMNIWFIQAYNGFTYMTPFAEVILQYCPQIYNPYYQIFTNRTNHTDTNRVIEILPVIYTDKNGCIRKILTSSENVEDILNSVEAYKNTDWLKSKLYAVDDISYISVPHGKYIGYKE